jgi:hypothetical protein
MADRTVRGRVVRGLLMGAIAVGSFVVVIVALEVVTDLWLSR